MDMNEQEGALSPEEEFKRLREKTDREDLTELKRGLMGGYRSRDVAAYVAQLKDQMQTAERTYKNRIAELTAEKDLLRAECAAIQDRAESRQTDEEATAAISSELAQARIAAEGFLADRGTLEEQIKSLTLTSDEAIAALKERAYALEQDQQQAQARADALVQEKQQVQARADALEQELVEAKAREADLLRAAEDALNEEREAARAGIEALQAEKEGLQVQLETLANRVEQAEAEYRRTMQDLQSNAEAERARACDAEARLEESMQQHEEAARHLETLAQENAALAARLETSGKSIQNLLEDKEEVENINAQLRKALNTLVVRAEAVVKENAVINSLLTNERDKVQQYHAMNAKLADMLARVRMANQMLDERVADMDNTMNRSEQGPVRQVPQSKQRYKPDADLLDSKLNPLKDILAELNSIQSSVLPYQQPSHQSEEKDKKPNFQYSVEKLELDCPPVKPDVAWEGLSELAKPFASNRLRDITLDDGRSGN